MAKPATTVDVEMLHPMSTALDDFKAGDRRTVSVSEAKSLVRGGMAKFIDVEDVAAGHPDEPAQAGKSGKKAKRTASFKPVEEK